MSKFVFGGGQEGTSKLDGTLSSEMMDENIDGFDSSVYSVETNHTLRKSLSTTSVESATSITSLELNEPAIFDQAPHDIYGEDEEVGKMRVAKQGDALPVEKWKLKKGCDIAVKFRVSSTLEVTVINRKSHPCAQQSQFLDSSRGPGMTSTPKKIKTGVDLKMTGEEDSEKKVVNDCQDVNDETKNKQRKLSKQEWLSDLSSNFLEIVIGGLEVSLRGKVSQKVKEKKKLTPKENMSLVHSVNHHIFNWKGPQTPDGSLSRDVAQLFKQHLPETFAYTEMVMTEFGPVPVKKFKGEGGVEGLASRIANNYYNRYVRVGITRPDGVDSGSKMDFSAKKQPRKIYAISADKWNLAQKLSQKEYDEEAKEFSTLDDLNSLESKAEMLESVREYLQIGFRTACNWINRLTKNNCNSSNHGKQFH